MNLDNIQREECRNKKRYPSLTTAKRHARVHSRLTKTELTTYQCPICKHYHLTKRY